MNPWKVAFAVALVLWTLSAAGLSLWALDRRDTADEAREMLADCRTHRDFLHEVARGGATCAELGALPPVTRTSRAEVVREVEARELGLECDAGGRYLGSAFSSSRTPK